MVAGHGRVKRTNSQVPHEHEREHIANVDLATPTSKSVELPDYFVTDDGHFAGKN
jgi:hypothetical protein